MVDEERWMEIRRLRDETRVSISELARRVDLDRKTVRRSLRQTTWQPYRRAAVTETLLTAHADFVRTRASPVTYSARILYQELRASRGYTGRYQTLNGSSRHSAKANSKRTGRSCGLTPRRANSVRVMGAKPPCPSAPVRR